MSLSATGSGPLVLILDECHTSRVGQLQNAIMLLRLHDQYGLRTIGFEDFVQRAQPLDAGWFHTVVGGLRG
jgi:hypothetical protein